MGRAATSKLKVDFIYNFDPRRVNAKVPQGFAGAPTR
jgi:hypothetical protein